MHSLTASSLTRPQNPPSLTPSPQAWTMCWDQRRCHLFSRLPSPLTPAKPSSAVNMLAQKGAGAYNAKCASGYSKGGCRLGV